MHPMFDVVGVPTGFGKTAVQWCMADALDSGIEKVVVTGEPWFG